VEEEAFEFRPVADGLMRLWLFAVHVGLGGLLVGLWKDVRVAYASLGYLALLSVAFLPSLRAVFRAVVRDADPAAPPRPGWIRVSNVVARADGPHTGPLFIFMAHVDSKSQSLSLAGRIGFYRWSRTATFGFLGAALARVFGADVPLPLLAALGGAAAAMTLPLYALRTHNRSPGALDNASGVGALVEMARIWRSLPAADSSRAVFLAVSGEEFGMVGSLAWVRRHLGELRGGERCRVLNLDGVGYGGPVWVVPSRGEMTEELKRAGEGVGRPLHPYPPGIGLMTDHVSFTREGIPCATLMTHSWTASRIHTERDVPESLSEEGFANVGAVAVRFVNETFESTRRGS
jgi:hypothetical protein